MKQLVCVLLVCMVMNAATTEAPRQVIILADVTSSLSGPEIDGVIALVEDVINRLRPGTTVQVYPLHAASENPPNVFQYRITTQLTNI